MITSASIIRVDTQKDGRNFVTEAQVDDTLGTFYFVYLLSPGDDANTIMAARTAALNAAATAVPTVTVTQDDGTTSTVRTYEIPNTDLRLTAGQKSAMVTARNVIDAVRPFYKVYQTLTSAQQQFVLNHTPWFAQVVAVFNGG